MKHIVIIHVIILKVEPSLPRPQVLIRLNLLRAYKKHQLADKLEFCCEVYLSSKLY